MLSSASTATGERNLRELRRILVGRRMSQTKPRGLPRREVPMLVGQWRELDTPGYLEIALVSHSGEFAAGEWIWTVCATDLSTGWTERVPVMGKGQTRIVEAWSASNPSCPPPCWDRTGTMAASSSFGTCCAGAARPGSCSPARTLSTRTTTAMWSTQQLADGTEVPILSSLLCHLASLVGTVVVPSGADENSAFQLSCRPPALQARTLDLLGLTTTVL